MKAKRQLIIEDVIYSQSQTKTYTMVLGERDGGRKLPIVIGEFEAQAIALAVDKITPKRPLTHDLFQQLTTAFGINLKEVLISAYRDRVFYSVLLFENETQLHEVDSRASDAIALAVRYNAPIYTYDEVLNDVGFKLEKAQPIVVSDDAKSENFDSFSDDEMENLLYLSLENEDYEKASMLRDELNKRKKKH